MQVGFGSLNTFSGSYRSTAALADMSAQRRPSEALPQEDASSAASKASSLKAAANISAQPVSLDEARASLDADTASFATAAGKILQNAGTALPPEVMLSLSSDGQIAVINSRPDAVQIEQQLANSPTLTTSFAQLAAKAALVRAADSTPALSQVDSAVAKIGGVRFHLVLTPQGPEVFFAGAGIAKA